MWRESTPLEVDASYESEMAATTHFVIVDREGNIVWTQSLSVHFGAVLCHPEPVS